MYHSDSGSIYIGTDGDAEEEETDAYEKSIVDRTSHKSLVQSDIEQNPDSAPPATPLSFGRYINLLTFQAKLLSYAFHVIILLKLLMIFFFFFAFQTTNAASIFVEEQTASIIISIYRILIWWYICCWPRGWKAEFLSTSTQV